MFSKKPINRKRHRRGAQDSRRLGYRQPESIESLRDKEFQLNAQIGELEKVLAHHDDEESRQNTMRRDNILPPPNYGSKVSKRKSLSYAEKRRLASERNKSGLYFLLLLAIAAVLAFWLFYTGG